VAVNRRGERHDRVGPPLAAASAHPKGHVVCLRALADVGEPQAVPASRAFFLIVSMSPVGEGLAGGCAAWRESRLMTGHRPSRLAGEAAASGSLFRASPDEIACVGNSADNSQPAGYVPRAVLAPCLA